ncbi:MAG: RnfABCDGE type electron transport complex subunit G [Cellulosilyticaceae bacterium]
MKEILKLGGVLLLITAICAGLLGFVNNLTQPLIAEGKVKATNEAIQKLLPEAKEVIKLEKTQDEKMLEVYVAKTEGVYVGSVAKVAPNGYGGTIEMLVGIDAEGKVAGVQILSHAETPGLGANMTKESFSTQFKGKDEGIGVTKGAASGNDISAITGATITSQAVTDGVNQVINYVTTHQESLMKEGN